jgi:predicted nucleic acid-binding protein
MEIAPGYLIDTNILLRLSHHDDPQHQLVKAVLARLDEQGEELYFSLQNIAEFWNVCTRPLMRNGYGFSIAETNRCVEEIERTMIFLPDNEQVYSV